MISQLHCTFRKKSIVNLNNCVYGLFFHPKMELFSVLVKAARSCLTLCDPMDYRVHGILQARILEWIAYPFSRGSSQPRDQTQVYCTGRWILYHWASREALHHFTAESVTWSVQDLLKNRRDSNARYWNRKKMLLPPKNCAITGEDRHVN